MSKKKSILIDVYKKSFQSLPKQSLHLDVLDKYIRNGDKLYVHKETGVVSSELKFSAKDSVNYWSNTIFEFNEKDDYSATFPFAQSRLFYVLRTLIDFLKIENFNEKISYCDFATGEGVLPYLVSKNCPNWNITVTESSQKLCKLISKNNYKIYNNNLGYDELENFQVNVASLCWTLCNCISPLDVLKDVNKHMQDNGYLIIAESSRVLVPFKKALRDNFQRVHPADTHPFHFSKNSLSALLKCSGFKTVFVNRYLDTDYLVIIAKKTKINDDEKIICDDYQDVIDYYSRLDDLTDYYKKFN